MDRTVLADDCQVTKLLNFCHTHTGRGIYYLTRFALVVSSTFARDIREIGGIQSFVGIMTEELERWVEMHSW